MERLTNANHKEIGFYSYCGPQNPFETPLTIGEIAGFITDYSPRKILEDIFARLAAYEDTGLTPDEIMQERVLIATRKDPEKLARLRDLVNADKAGRIAILPPNDPLTLEELREMDGEPVWITKMDRDGGAWMLVDAEYELCREAHGEMAVFENCGISPWLAYRRKPEETS